MADKDPLDAAAEDAKRNLKKAWDVLVERGREWLSIKLTIVVIGMLVGAVAAAVSLPVFAATACIGFGVVAVVYAIYARRLMYQERVARHQAAISALRARQRGLRHEAAVCEATLALAGKQNERGSKLGFRGASELLAAIRYSQAGRAFARRSRLTAGADTKDRASLPTEQQTPPRQPDVTKSRQRLLVLEAEEKSIEAQIQALAYPLQGTVREAKLAREEWRRIRDADRETQKRGRRGQQPWPEHPGMAFEVGTKPDGLPHARRLPPRPTPEQIARGDDAANRPAA